MSGRWRCGMTSKSIGEGSDRGHVRVVCLVGGVKRVSDCLSKQNCVIVETRKKAGQGPSTGEEREHSTQTV